MGDQSMPVEAAVPLRPVPAVGVVCLRLGTVVERRGVARKLAAELIQRADTLMYDAKGRRADHVYATAVRVERGELVELPEFFDKCQETRDARQLSRARDAR